ncbi:MAG: hypothetical protein R2744_04155 [Bacteroidales bacterium]
MTDHNWHYINTMVLLAGAYEEIGEYLPACKIYEKIMTVEPSVNWVKNSLYPLCVERFGKSGKKKAAVIEQQ